MQAAAKSNIAVGHQYQYNGVTSAIATIVKNEGFMSLYRGSSMSVLRSMLGSGSNLASYSALREYILLNKLLSDNSFTDALCSMTSSAVTAVAMNPVDVIRTRVFNQPVSATGEGLLYKSGADALVKILANEGPTALMKGALASFMRLGPHFTLTFVFFEQMKRFSLNQMNMSQTKQRIAELHELFSKYDRDTDNVLSMEELANLVKSSLPRAQEHFLSDEQYEELIRRDIEKLLVDCDKNRNRVIEFEEFENVVSSLEQVIHQHEINSAFLYFDKDGNGRIDKNEMMIALKTLVPKSEKTSNLEYEQSLRKDVDAIMAFADTDRSGYIEFNEFASIVDKLPTVRAERVVKSLISNIRQGTMASV
jgi:Ca2+-binding EF-hand superfamily protein